MKNFPILCDQSAKEYQKKDAMKNTGGGGGGGKVVIDPFSTNAPLLYPLKTSENLWFIGLVYMVFTGYRSGKLV